MAKDDRSKMTISIPEGLKREAKAQAALQGRNFSEVLQELIRKWLEEQQRLPHPQT